MSSFIHLGNKDFTMSRYSEIYVDKSELIKQTNRFINQENRFLCVSRPRRFGKTMAANMIASYYDESCDSRLLFSGLAIAKEPSFEKHLNKYPVIKLDVGGFIAKVLDKERLTLQLHNALLKELKDVYKDYVPKDVDTVATALAIISSKIGKQFVFVIDEWDAIFRECADNEKEQETFLNFLRSLFKNSETIASIALCYMTGILPIKKYNTQSAMNNFTEFSMIDPLDLAPFVGFTEREVKKLCISRNADFNAMKYWYDGYSFSNVKSVFSPYSVVKALIHNKIKNYWTDSSSYDDAASYINMNFDGLKEAVTYMISGGRYPVNVRSFANDFVTLHDKNQVMTLLIHLGYLAYDEESKEAYIPNKEVEEKIFDSIVSSNWGITADAVKNSERLLKAVFNKEEDKVAAGVRAMHQSLSSFITYNNESDLNVVVLTSFMVAQNYYKIVRELSSGDGYSDLAFIPKQGFDVKPMIVELKWNRSADVAVKQIKDKEYYHFFKDYKEVVVCGINYSVKDKKYTCKIETVQL